MSKTKLYLFGGALKKTLKTTGFLSKLEGKSILFIPFAKSKSYWDKSYKTFDFLIGKEGLSLVKFSTFKKQVETSDVLLFSGGSEHELIKNLNLLGADLNDLIKGKIVVGSSAGANVFSKYYYSNDRKIIEKGLGVCNIKTICHFDSSKSVPLAELKTIEPSLKTVALKEGSFLEIKKVV